MTFIEMCEEGERLAEMILSELLPIVLPHKRHWKKKEFDFPIKRHWKKKEFDFPHFEHWPTLESPEGYIVSSTTERKHIEDTERWYEARKQFDTLLQRWIVDNEKAGVKSLQQAEHLDEATGRSVFCELYEKYYDLDVSIAVPLMFDSWLSRVRGV